MPEKGHKKVVKNDDDCWKRSFKDALPQLEQSVGELDRVSKLTNERILDKSSSE